MSSDFLHIPTPCHVPWAGMTPAEGGRHCAQCDRVVRDFTALSPSEVTEQVAQSKEPICGRVKATALRSPIQGIGLADFAWRRLQIFAYAFVAVFAVECLGSSNLDAQDLPSELRTTRSMSQAANEIARPSEVNLKGRVEDVYTREPVAYAHVMAYAGDSLLAGTMSDSVGRFELHFPQALVIGENYELRLRYQGSERRDHFVHQAATEYLYLIDASRLMEGLTIDTKLEIFDVWEIDHYIVGMLALDVEQVERTLYRPLDEWLMMNFSEIHHSGRW